MGTSTPAELADAYRLVRAAETRTITDIASIRDEFFRSLDAVAAQLPEEAAVSPAGSYLTRVRSAVTGVFGFDLTNLKHAYGIGETPSEPQA